MDTDNSFIGAFVRDAIRTKDPELRRMLDTILSTNGKLVRTHIAVEIAEALNPTASIPDSVLARLETLHLASLIHDDIIDQSAIRRGMPSVWARYSVNAAILLGDLLYAIVPLAANDIPGLNDRQRIELIHEFSKASTFGQQGQILESLNLYNPHIPIRQYLRIADLKTSSLIYLACYIGWCYTSTDRSALSDLKKFARYFGRAFQAYNDVTDFFENNGKKALDDIKAGTTSLPIIWHYRNSPGSIHNSHFDWSPIMSNEQCQQLAQTALIDGSVAKSASLAAKNSRIARHYLEKALGSGNLHMINTYLNTFADVHTFVSPKSSGCPSGSTPVA